MVQLDEWQLCARSETVNDDHGLRMVVDRVDQSLAGYDLLILPGGFGTRALMKDAAFLDWLRTASEVPLKASVCTGSLLLGAAGFLVGKRATTHPSAVAELAPFCAEVVEDRIVDEGNTSNEALGDRCS